MNYEKHGHEGGVDCEEEEDLLFHCWWVGVVVGWLVCGWFWLMGGWCFCFGCENLLFLIIKGFDV